MRIWLPVLCLVAGCAAGPQLKVRSDPPGATVIYRDREVGQTPITLTVPKDEVLPDLTLRFTKPGFAPADITLHRRVAWSRIAGQIVLTGGIATIISGAYGYPPFRPVKLEVQQAPAEQNVKP